MIPFESVHENFRFMVLEIQNMVNATYEWMKNPTAAGYERLEARDDYVDNLKNTIENQCYSLINTHKDLRPDRISEIRALQIMAVNLERLGDNCINILGQMAHLKDPRFIENYNYAECFSAISRGIAGITAAFDSRSLTGALGICRMEPELDRLYKIYFDRIMEEMNSGGDAQTLLTVLFIFRYFERMGDTLLNIGEALIFSLLGQKLKIHQFEALQRNLFQSGFDATLKDTDMEAILGTRSGCRVSRVEQGAVEEHRQDGIFKEGNPNKLRAEKASLDRWAAFMPGLVPRVLSFHEHPETAAMLVEFLPGYTLDEVLLNDDDILLGRAFDALRRTIRDVWSATRRQAPVCTDYVHQIPSRLDAIRKVYPEFFRPEQTLNGARAASSEELIQFCLDIQEQLTAPASVLIHGDFNVNNIVFNPDTSAIHYIDLHRSTNADFIQDISVLLISNFRIPAFKARIRRRLNTVIRDMYAFAADTAREWEDHTFPARMALALARSFYTSTRFELNAWFAKAMYLRAHYLMEKVVAHEQNHLNWETFELPEAVLYY